MPATELGLIISQLFKFDELLVEFSTLEPGFRNRGFRVLHTLI